MTAAPDRCPFARPFPPGFSSCPAYQLSTYVPLDTAYEALAPVNSCSHLRMREQPGRPYSYYGSCRIGDASDRAAWVSLVSGRRLELMRGVQEALAARTAAQVADLYAAKSAQLRSQAPGDQLVPLRRAATAYMEAATATLIENADILDQVELPVATCVDLVRLVLDNWIEGSTMQPEPIPTRFLDGLSAVARALIEPPGAD